MSVLVAMMLTYCYRLVPRKAQHRALEAILESQRQLYNAALEERIGAYRSGNTRNYVDQWALTECGSDPEAASVPSPAALDPAARRGVSGLLPAAEGGCRPGFPGSAARGR
jgi:putative transposase